MDIAGGTPAAPAVLVVEDDEAMAECIAAALSGSTTRPTVVTAPSIGRARQALEMFIPDAVILDLCPGEPRGLEFLRELRTQARTERVPVMVVTGSMGDRLIAECFETGAQDYLQKPFDPEELLARVEALFRKHARPAVLEWGPLSLDMRDRSAALDGMRFEATPTEFELLRHLVSAGGAVVQTPVILSAVLGVQDAADSKAARKNLLAHVSNLRKRLGTRKRLVRNVRGVGYRLSPLGRA